MATVGEIAGVVGLDEDACAFLGAASVAERRSLVAAIERAAKDRDRELRAAVDHALGFIPRPLRGRVLKMLGGSRG
ncbi:hypothetical protein [Actinospongicola halichondriae]|uniref:hypothetical protein n=1 Tax=Actinospongicola halichondriae TaxID=3236844 RepID=UPI003D39257C